jgi:hypothetical protein
MAKKWIQGAIKKKGALRKTLKLKKGEKVTLAKLNKYGKKKGISTKTKRRIALAKTLSKLRRK